MLFPSRSIPRKNVRAAFELAQRWRALLWLLGPAEDGFEQELNDLLASYAIPTRRGLPSGYTIHDAYSACDLVVVPSTWEGFGNPVVESVTHGRPLAVYPYPVLEEIRSTGMTFFDLESDEIGDVMLSPPHDVLARNKEIAAQHYSLADLPDRLSEVLQDFAGRLSL
jgi:glycosyltransferase involved in cell wall biosynthesis